MRRLPLPIILGPLFGLFVLVVALWGSGALQPTTTHAIGPECDPLSPPSRLYGAGRDPDRLGADLLYEINETNGDTFEVGPIIDVLNDVDVERVSGIDFRPGTNELFGTGSVFDDFLEREIINLYRINPCDAEATLVGPVEIGAIIGDGEEELFPDSITDISFRSDGRLYAHAFLFGFGRIGIGDIVEVGVGCFGSCLLLFDEPLTGYAMVVGPTELDETSGNAIGFDPDDTLFHGDEEFFEPLSLHILDQDDGFADFIASFLYLSPIPSFDFFGEVFARPNAFDYDPVTDMMYASVNAGFGGSGPNFLATVDLFPAEGEPSIVVPVGDSDSEDGNTVPGLDAIAFTTQVLENFVDLTITKFDNLDPVAKGGTLLYSGRIQNNGDLPATGVRLIDQLPANFSLRSVSIFPGGFDCSDTIIDGLLKCDINGGLDPGDIVNYEIIGVVNNDIVVPNTITNVIEVELNEDDQFPGNNVATEDTHVMPALSGQVTQREFGISTGPAVGAEIVLCPLDLIGVPIGPCQQTQTDGFGNYQFDTLVARDYRLTAHSDNPDLIPVEIVALSLVSVNPIVNDNANVPVFQDMILRTVQERPPGAGIEPTRRSWSGSDNPIVYWRNELEIFSSPNCISGIGTWKLLLGGVVVRSGNMTEGPPGTYGAVLAPLFPLHGHATVEIAIDCPGVAPDEDANFHIYIDPSGTVVDQFGTPIEGATVTLLRSDSAGGPFDAVPNGSTIMSPANRSNPDTTDAAGHFGWDVFAGFYIVEATAPGCSTTATEVLTIPPPVTDLLLVLECETGPVNINDSLTLISLGTSYDASDPRGDAGVFTVSAEFLNETDGSFFDVFFVIAVLDGNGCECTVLNADGGPGGEGSVVSVGDVGPGETFSQDFEISLTTQESFEFFVDVFGSLFP